MTIAGAQSGAFDMGRVFSRTIEVLRANAISFGTMALLLSVLPDALIAGYSLFLVPPAAADASQSVDWMAALSGNQPPGAGIISNLAYIFLAAALTVGTLAHLAGQTKTAGRCLSEGGAVFVRCLQVSILTGFGILAGLILLVVPGLILAAMWVVAQPVTVAESKGVLDSIRRSSDLTKGHRAAVLGASVVGVIVALAIIIGFGLVFGVISSVSRPIYIVGEILLNPMITALGLTILPVLNTCIYHELKVAKEGVAAGQVASVFS